MNITLHYPRTFTLEELHQELAQLGTEYAIHHYSKWKPRWDKGETIYKGQSSAQIFGAPPPIKEKDTVAYYYCSRAQTSVEARAVSFWDMYSKIQKATKENRVIWYELVASFYKALCLKWDELIKEDNQETINKGLEHLFDFWRQ